MYRLIKFLTVFFMLSIILGCHSTTETKNDVNSETENNNLSQNCSNEISSSSHSDLNPIINNGCPVD